jgi:hypothetical protein
MNKLVSFYDIIRYVYEETSVEEQMNIEYALFVEADDDSELLQFFYECIQTKSDLNKLVFEPSSAVIDNIVAYSMAC